MAHFLEISKKIFLLSLLFVSTTAVFAQKSGLIFQQPATGVAGRTVLDPNNDGYISETSSGFLSGNDLTESEIKYKPIPQLVFEPNSDLATGPNCGFTDFVDDGGEYAAGVYFDNTNFLFRFRLAGTANNSKGYSILIDTDQKMGAYGEHQDPNYTPGNPGFEIEVVLQTNFGVYLYDVDGKTSPVQKGSVLAYSDFSQKSVAENIYSGAACPDKYFYDFYIPFSVITTYFPNITTSTPLRFVANTVIAPKSVLQGPISDIQGVDDKSYASSDLAWTAAISNIYPTSVSSLNNTSTSFPNRDRTASIPVLGSPINPLDNSVSVTVSDTGLIKIYKVNNPVPVCSLRVGSSGIKTVAGCTTFNGGDNVYATLTKGTNSESETSNTVLVKSCAGTLTAAPTIDIKTTQGEKGITGTCVSGAVVKLYNNGVFQSGFVPTVTGTTWTINFCGGTAYSQSCIPCGTWQATATSGTKCESPLSEPFCWSSTKNACTLSYSTTTAPGIDNSTEVYNTDKVITGTAPSGATVYLYINNMLTKTVTAIGTTWTADGLTLNTGDTLYARALAPDAAPVYYCRSIATANVIVKQVKLMAPAINSLILAAATSVLGSSIEAANTNITVYKNVNGSISQLGSTTVATNGTWTLSNLSISALATGNILYATASASGKTTSDNSNTVIVQGGAESIKPTISNTSYSAGATQVKGTLPVNTSAYTIVLYLDGVQIGTTTTSSGDTSWTMNSLSTSTTSDNYLYSGGYLTAKAYRNNITSVGPASNSVPVVSTPPLNKTWTNTSTEYFDDPTTVDISIDTSEIGVIYSIVNSLGELRGNSRVGTGGKITLTSIASATTDTLYVMAEKIAANIAPLMLTGKKIIIVDREADYTNNTIGKNDAYSDNATLATAADADGVISSASVTSGTMPSWMSLSSNGTITVLLAKNIEPGTYNFTVSTSNVLNGNTGNTATPLSMSFGSGNVPLPVEFIAFEGKYKNGKVELNWSTATEINNNYFSIERSTEGMDFYEIGRKEGAGNSFNILKYDFTDQNPFGGVSYYRIKQTDFNGAFDYSKTISIRKTSAAEVLNTLAIYPNPSNGNVINIYASNLEGNAIAYLYDGWGRMIMNTPVSFSNDRAQLNLHEKTNVNLRTGIYTLLIDANKGSFKAKFIID